MSIVSLYIKQPSLPTLSFHGGRTDGQTEGQTGERTKRSLCIAFSSKGRHKKCTYQSDLDVLIVVQAALYPVQHAVLLQRHEAERQHVRL